MQDGKNHASKERLTDAASSTQRSKLVFHYSEPAEEEWKPAVPDWDLVPALYRTQSSHGEYSVRILFPPLIPCTMPHGSKKPKPFSRFFSFLGGRGSKSAVDSHEIASADPGSSRQSRSENIVESSQCAAISMPANQDFLRPPRPQPLPVQQPQAYSNPGALESMSGYGGTSFLAGASRFQMGDVHYFDHVNQVNVQAGGGAGDGSIDGTSVESRGWTRISLNCVPTCL